MSSQKPIGALYVKIAGQIYGPMGAVDLQRMAREHRIAPSDAVRKGEQGQWVEARNVKGLFSNAAQEITSVRTVLPDVLQPARDIFDVEPDNPPMIQVPRGISIPTPASISQPLAPIEQPRIPCRFCGELIVASAIKCRHCNEFLDGREAAQPISMYPQSALQPIHVIVNNNTAIDNAHQITNESSNENPINIVTSAVAQANNLYGRRRQARWSRVVAMFLSLLFPGLGQLYKGQFLNALAWCIVVIVGYTVLVPIGLLLHLCCIVGAGMGDPYQ